jgi:hypothetical protein
MHFTSTLAASRLAVLRSVIELSYRFYAFAFVARASRRLFRVVLVGAFGAEVAKIQCRGLWFYLHSGIFPALLGDATGNAPQILRDPHIFLRTI